jgi:15-cis-phytoene synthase
MQNNGYSLAKKWSNYDAAMVETERVIRQHSKTFFFATALLPAHERSGIRALYAFCRASDDLADCETTRPEDFENWLTEVNRTASEQTNPLLVAWAHIREQYGVDRKYERELLDGIRMDLQFRQYPTWEDLEKYCYRVASTVGLLSMPIIGLASGVSFEQAAVPAIKLGIALQLTNILRDVGEDLQRGRIYLPVEDLARFGLEPRDIQNQVYDDRFVRLMQFEIRRARALYNEALPGISLLSVKARPAVGAAALLYRRILDEIEAIDYRVFHQRAYTSTLRKFSMLPEIYFTVKKFQRDARAR